MTIKPNENQRRRHEEDPLCRPAAAGSLASALPLAAHAQSSVTLYGVIDAGITYVNKVATTTGHDSILQYGDGVSQGSRFGIRGTEDLGGGMKALFAFSDLGDRFKGRWHQINGAVDYALSKRTDIYFLAIFQKASGSNSVGGRPVPVQAEIGSAPSFIGNAGANSQLVTRVGLRHKF